MAALNVSPSQVRAALAANNYLSAVGTTKGQLVQVNLTANTDLRSAGEFEQMVVRQSGGATVRIRDIADALVREGVIDQSWVFIGGVLVLKAREDLKAGEYFVHAYHGIAQYLGLDGMLGTPLQVAATFIILFTIYGAILEFTGAGKFYVDLAFALTGRRPTGAARTVTLASFLLGTVSGSGVATTVTLGSIAYPMLKRAGHDRESSGAILSAGGIGAVISPPVLGPMTPPSTATRPR